MKFHLKCLHKQQLLCGFSLKDRKNVWKQTELAKKAKFICSFVNCQQRLTFTKKRFAPFKGIPLFWGAWWMGRQARSCKSCYCIKMVEISTSCNHSPQKEKLNLEFSHALRFINMTLSLINLVGHALCFVHLTTSYYSLDWYWLQDPLDMSIGRLSTLLSLWHLFLQNKSRHVSLPFIETFTKFKALIKGSPTLHGIPTHHARFQQLFKC